MTETQRVSPMEQQEKDFTNYDMIEALQEGSLETVMFLRTKQVALPGRALNFAAESGNEPLMKYLSNEGYVPTEETISSASRHGHFKLVKQLVESGVQPVERNLVAVGEGGNIELFKYLFDVLGKIRVPYEAYLEAIHNRHYDLLKWMLKECPEPDSEEVEVDSTMMDAAFGTGQLEMVDLLYKFGYDDEPTQDAARIAAENGNAEIVKKLDEDFGYFEVDLFTSATSGHLELLKYAHQKGIHIGGRELRAASINNHRKVVEWMIDELSPSDETLSQGLEGAAVGGHLELFKYILGHINPEELKQYQMLYIASSAAEGGNVEIMKLVLDTFTIDNINYVVQYAIVNGNVEILKLLDVQQLMVSESAVGMVIKNGYLRMLNYIVERGAKLPSDAMESAFNHNQLGVIQYLLERGCTIDRWYQCDSLELVKLLYQHLGTPDSTAADSFVHVNNLSALVFLSSVGVRFRTEQVDGAVRYGYLAMVKFMYSKGLELVRSLLYMITN